MTAPPHSKNLWDQSAFEEFKVGWNWLRRRDDERQLKEIFNLAADSPIFAAALDWANAHGVKFFIDRKTVDWGYYRPGTGVLGIAKNAVGNPAEAVATIVHEIRHAWQEYYDMSKGDPDSFSEAFIKIALTEADAEAFGLRAADQIYAASLKRSGRPLPSSLQASLADESADLGEKFLSWFDVPQFMQSYGGEDLLIYGQDYSLSEELTMGTHDEFESDLSYAGGDIGIDNIQDVMPLGRGFSGTHNYLAALQPDILPKKILRPSLADTFWGAANDDQKKLAAEVRKFYLWSKLDAGP
jgi:hypothetical protein